MRGDVAQPGEASLREVRGPGVWWMIDREFEDAAQAAGLLDAARQRALLAAGAGSDAPVASVGRSATTLLALPGRRERLHLRRALHGGLLARLWCGRIAGFGRVRSELLVTAALRARGAAVPRPVLAFAHRAGPLWRAAIATLHEEQAVDGVAFLEQAPGADRIELAAEAAGRAIRRFHELGGRHRDLHLKNLLIREPAASAGADARCEAILIDLDRARLAAPPGPRRRARELARLERSLRKRGLLARLGERGRSAFLAAYHAAQ